MKPYVLALLAFEADIHNLSVSCLCLLIHHL
jgi:hypothetical protein